MLCTREYPIMLESSCLSISLYLSPSLFLPLNTHSTDIMHISLSAVAFIDLSTVVSCFWTSGDKSQFHLPHSCSLIALLAEDMCKAMYPTSPSKSLRSHWFKSIRTSRDASCEFKSCNSRAIRITSIWRSCLDVRGLTHLSNSQPRKSFLRDLLATANRIVQDYLTCLTLGSLSTTSVKSDWPRLSLDILEQSKVMDVQKQ